MVLLFILNQFNQQVSRVGRERRHRHGARIGIVLQDYRQHSRLFDPDDQHQLSYWPIDQDRRGIKSASVENRSNRQVRQGTLPRHTGREASLEPLRVSWPNLRLGLGLPPYNPVLEFVLIKKASVNWFVFNALFNC